MQNDAEMVLEELLAGRKKVLRNTKTGRMQKQYVHREPSDLSHYIADAFTVRCFDNRFWRAFKHFIKQSQNIGHIDLESLAGGAKVLASPEHETDREAVLREIEKSIRLHHVRCAMLFTHQDCGAYGGSVRFNGDMEQEFEFHAEELRRAAAIVRERFPDLAVEAYFIDTEGIIQVV